MKSHHTLNTDSNEHVTPKIVFFGPSYTFYEIANVFWEYDMILSQHHNLSIIPHIFAHGCDFWKWVGYCVSGRQNWKLVIWWPVAHARLATHIRSSKHTQSVHNRKITSYLNTAGMINGNAIVVMVASITGFHSSSRIKVSLLLWNSEPVFFH